MTSLRFLGVLFLLIILLGWALQLNGAVIVALIFFVGCPAIVIVWIIHIIGRYW